MQRNESSMDRIMRVVGAAVLAVVAAAFGAGSVLGIVLLALAAVLAVTAAVGLCPFYRLMGVSTAKAHTTAAAPSSR